MDSLKTVVIVCLLAAIAYGVYVTINKDQEAAVLPEGVDGWPSGPPSVQLGPQSEAPPFSIGSPGDGTMPGDPPTMSIHSDATPAPTAGRYATDRPDLRAPDSAKMAPSFNPPNGAAGATGSQLPPPIAGAETTPDYRSRPTGPGMSQTPPMTPGIGRSPHSPARQQFAEFMAAARQQLDQGKFVEMHEALSAWRGEERLTPDEARQLTELLDQVAGTVIYSPQHFLEPAYRVRPGDTLAQIAETYGVTPQLLAKINGIADPGSLEPGTELKVVRGPFDASIDLDVLELTLSLQGRYAGRFKIGKGNDRPQLEGSYTVREKMIGPTYYGRDGTVASNDPNNPLGKHWIGLENRVGIHGTNDPNNVGTVDGRGSVCLGDRDVEDVFDILTVDSRVVIRR